MDSKSQPKATVVIKVIRRDGTEEVYLDEEATVADASLVEKLMKKLKGGE